MVKCQVCGAQVNEQYPYCNNCGAAITSPQNNPNPEPFETGEGFGDAGKFDYSVNNSYGQEYSVPKGNFGSNPNFNPYVNDIEIVKISDNAFILGLVAIILGWLGIAFGIPGIILSKKALGKTDEILRLTNTNALQGKALTARILAKISFPVSIASLIISVLLIVFYVLYFFLIVLFSV